MKGSTDPLYSTIMDANEEYTMANFFKRRVITKVYQPNNIFHIHWKLVSLWSRMEGTPKSIIHALSLALVSKSTWQKNLHYPLENFFQTHHENHSFPSYYSSYVPSSPFLNARHSPNIFSWNFWETYISHQSWILFFLSSYHFP